MTVLTRYIVCFFLLISSLPVYSQSERMQKADRHFEEGRYKKALHLYRKARLKPATLMHRHDYAFFYPVFQIAECKRLLKCRDSLRGYERIERRLYKLEMSGSGIEETSLQLLYAESKSMTGDYFRGEEFYRVAANKKDSIPDRFRFGFAYSSMMNSRYLQAVQLFERIKNKQKFEPVLSHYIIVCEKELSKNIAADLGNKDTLVIAVRSMGCFGGSYTKYEFVKSDSGIRQTSYKWKRVNGDNTLAPVSTQLMPDSSYMK